jgi:hypothetical protein
MTLDDLKTFIAHTRHQEGVSWYLRDDSPQGTRDISYILLAFDAQGELVTEIPGIQEQPGRRIDQSIIGAISALRAQVGVNAGFLRNYKTQDGSTAQAHFEACRDRWMQSPPAGFLKPIGAQRA